MIIVCTVLHHQMCARPHAGCFIRSAAVFTKTHSQIRKLRQREAKFAWGHTASQVESGSEPKFSKVYACLPLCTRLPLIPPDEGWMRGLREMTCSLSLSRSFSSAIKTESFLFTITCDVAINTALCDVSLILVCFSPWSIFPPGPRPVPRHIAVFYWYSDRFFLHLLL